MDDKLWRERPVTSLEEIREAAKVSSHERWAMRMRGMDPTVCRWPRGHRCADVFGCWEYVAGVWLLACSGK